MARGGVLPCIVRRTQSQTYSNHSVGLSEIRKFPMLLWVRYFDVAKLSEAKNIQSKCQFFGHAGSYLRDVMCWIQFEWIGPTKFQGGREVDWRMSCSTGSGGSVEPDNDFDDFFHRMLQQYRKFRPSPIWVRVVRGMRRRSIARWSTSKVCH